MDPDRRVVVVGGSGFLGSRAVTALKKARRTDRRDCIPLERASRRPLGPSSYEALRGADVVVDLADATTFPPDALARWCLEHGIVFVETTSDMVAVDRLAKIAAADPSGAIILGAGIMRAAADRAGPGARLELAVRSSPFSGCRQRHRLAHGEHALKLRCYRGGERVQHPPMGRGPRVDFPSGSAPTLRVPFAEEVMLHVGSGARDVDVYFSPKPSLLVWAFSIIPVFIVRSKLFAAFMRTYFTFLRCVLLGPLEHHRNRRHRRRPRSSHQARSHRARRHASRRPRHRRDCRRAPRPPRAPPRHAHDSDEVVKLAPVLDRMRTLGGAEAIVLHVMR